MLQIAKTNAVGCSGRLFTPSEVARFRTVACPKDLSKHLSLVEFIARLRGCKPKSNPFRIRAIALFLVASKSPDSLS